MMRRLFLAAFVVLIGGGLYVLSPFWAAWTLREAIKAGDTKTIERKVVWEGVRQSLRASIAGNSQLLPEANSVGETIRPSLWQRVKTAFGASMLDRFIESYVTPEGLPKLFRYRRTWNGTMKGEPDEDAMAFTERARRFYSRVTRAEFKSTTVVEIEMADKNTPARRYITTMELHGTEWKLAALRVVGGGPISAGSAPRDLMGMP